MGRSLGLVFAIMLGLAGPALAIEDDNLLVPLAQVQAAPKASIGKNARWGGEVATINRTERGLQVEVIAYPLVDDEWPDVDQADSIGRFRFYLSGEGGEDLRPGLQLTVRGRVLGSETDEGQGFKRQLPVLQAESYRLWRHYDHRHRDRWRDDPWHDRYHDDPYWRRHW
ncbi:MAG: Slp family lipoprotein [Gammaproteobacteria bacterium]|nr:Slp family lipoprotein [Gammaproteobacteria bacterium]